MRTLQNVDYALDYAGLGWRVIPVDPNKKHPVWKNWHRLATTDEDKIIAWWDEFPDMGVGVQFGPTSGIIDIEADSEEATAQLAAAMGGDIPPTPTFLSGRRKLPHRIFRFSDLLPPQANLDLRRFGIEADLKIGWADSGSQSVFPPTGAYAWARGSDYGILEPAELPQEFMVWLTNGAEIVAESVSEETIKGTGEGSRNDSLLRLAGSLAGAIMNLGDPAAQTTYFAKLQTVNMTFRPPMGADEVLQVGNNVLRMEAEKRSKAIRLEAAASVPVVSEVRENAAPAAREQRTADSPPDNGADSAADSGQSAVDTDVEPTRGDPIDIGAFGLHEVKLELVHHEDEPCEYRLYAREFARLTGCRLALTYQQINSWRLLAMEMGGRVGIHAEVSNARARAWKAPGGPLSMLFDCMVEIDGEKFSDQALMAAALLDWFKVATPFVPSANFERGKPMWDSAEKCYYAPNLSLRNRLRDAFGKFEVRILWNLLDAVRANRRFGLRVGGDPTKVCMFDEESIRRLKMMAMAGPVD